jgi:hypothetical protein
MTTENYRRLKPRLELIADHLYELVHGDELPKDFQRFEKSVGKREETADGDVLYDVWGRSKGGVYFRSQILSKASLDVNIERSFGSINARFERHIDGVLNQTTRVSLSGILCIGSASIVDVGFNSELLITPDDYVNLVERYLDYVAETTALPNYRPAQEEKFSLLAR